MMKKVDPFKVMEDALPDKEDRLRVFEQLMKSEHFTEEDKIQIKEKIQKIKGEKDDKEF